jgi:hypothetical protein
VGLGRAKYQRSVSMIAKLSPAMGEGNAKES